MRAQPHHPARLGEMAQPAQCCQRRAAPRACSACGVPTTAVTGPSSLGSMQTNSRVVCSANTVVGNTNTQPARAGLCWNPLAPGQDSAPGVGMGPGTTAAEVTFRRSVGGHAPVPGLLVPASQRMGWGGTHPHQPHYPKLQPNLTCAHPLPHS